MKRDRETIRDPKNWETDPTTSNPWMDHIDQDNDAYESVEDISDIREFERQNYYTVLEEIAEREKIALADEQYYQEYETWYDDTEERSRKKIDRLAIPETILTRYPVLADLPRGVCVMGGMARSIAREIITGDVEPIRDIDLVNIVDDNGASLVSDETLDFLSRKYMPDDYAFGYGVKNEQLGTYFETRDFTINQCLISNRELLLTRQAYDDFQENIIRPTDYELPDRGSGLSSRLFMKSLMMKTVIKGVTSSIPLLEDVDIDIEQIYPFDIALTLNKMMSRGAEMAFAFTEELVEWGIIPEEYKDRPMHTASILLNYVYNFEFRPTNFDGADDIADVAREYYSEGTLRHYHSRDARIQSIIDEYDELGPHDFQDLGQSFYLGGERIKGKYTLQDYELINNGLQP